MINRDRSISIGVAASITSHHQSTYHHHTHVHIPAPQEPLTYDAEHHALLSASIGVRYPIDPATGIPNLIPREATIVGQGEGEEVN